MKCKGCEANGEYGCRAGFTSIVINGEMGCENADRALAAFRAKDKVGMTVYPSRKDNKRRPISRADNIRAMTDEELAEWLDNNTYRFPIYKDWLDWLRQEVEE